MTQILCTDYQVRHTYVVDTHIDMNTYPLVTGYMFQAVGDLHAFILIRIDHTYSKLVCITTN